MHDRTIYLPHSISWNNPINHTGWFTGRRAAALVETDRCIIASSGRRWWVSKAVSCHRNPQRTIQRKQHRRLSGVISTHPLSATPPSHTHSTRSRRRCVWCEDRRATVVVLVVSRGDESSESSSRLADDMCQKEKTIETRLSGALLFCHQAEIRSGRHNGTLPG